MIFLKRSNKLKSENEDSENEIYDNNLQTKRSQKYPEYKKNDDLGFSL